MLLASAPLAVAALVLVLALILRAIWIPRGVTDLGWGTLGSCGIVLGVDVVFCAWAHAYLLAAVVLVGLLMIAYLCTVKAQDLLRAKWRPPLPVPPADETYDAPDVGQRDRFHAALSNQLEQSGPLDPVEAERARSDRMARLFG